MAEYTPPKYFTVKHSIMKMLDSGELEANAPLPSERELMEAHNVSRITVRKAIEELEQRDWYTRYRGRAPLSKAVRNSKT